MKPWKMLWATALCIICLAALVACGGGSGASTDADAKKAASAEAEVIVPDVVGKSGDAALVAIADAGLLPYATSDNDKTVIDWTNWTVLEQDPAAGTKAAEGDLVTLTMTKAELDADGTKAATAVPDVVGMTCDKAVAAIEFAGLEADVASDTGKAVLSNSNWTVVEQSPAAGEQAESASTVKLLVTKSADGSESSGGSAGADAGGVTPSVKEALDSYEAFVDSYVAFMEKYESSDDPGSMMPEYLDFVAKLAEAEARIDALDEDAFTPADDAYYIEVMARCDQKLLTVAAA